jgi:uncharacterized protein involved in exopolysaccharide biosynthesis
LNTEDRASSRQLTPATQLIDLREFFRILGAYRWLIAGIVITGTVLTVVVALLMPNIYRADTLLAPNEEQTGGGLSSLAEQYGGLAALAGVDLMDGSEEKTTLGLAVLNSRKFISDFVKRHDILVELFAAEGWDRESGELIIDPDEYDVEAETWVRKVRLPRKVVPSMQEAYEKFTEDVLTIGQNSRTGYVTITVEHYSPYVAKQWVTWLVEDLNETIMQKDVHEAKQAIEYLNEQIKATSLAELRSVFSRLIEEQTKTIMLAAVTDEYLFKTVDPPVAPEEKIRPKRSIIVLLGAFLSGVVALLLVVFLNSRRKA